MWAADSADTGFPPGVGAPGGENPPPRATRPAVLAAVSVRERQERKPAPMHMRTPSKEQLTKGVSHGGYQTARAA
jgi:hypothetical protein